MDLTPTQTIAAALEEVIWTIPFDAAADAVIHPLVKAHGDNLRAILAEMSDGTLALAIRKQVLRNKAFEELLVDRYERRILRWFWNQVHNIDQAQELVQGFYLKLLLGRTLDSFDACRPFAPWLWRVVQNFWYSELRRARRETSPLDDQLAVVEPDPCDEACCNELEGRIEAAMRELPPDQRSVLREAMNGARADEIAHGLGQPKQRVFQLLFKARRHVERALGPDSGRTRRTDAEGETRVPLEDCHE